jgi:WD40 repeat protein
LQETKPAIDRTDFAFLEDDHTLRSFLVTFGETRERENNARSNRNYNIICFDYDFAPAARKPWTREYIQAGEARGMAASVDQTGFAFFDDVAVHVGKGLAFQRQEQKWALEPRQGSDLSDHNVRLRPRWVVAVDVTIPTRIAFPELRPSGTNQDSAHVVVMSRNTGEGQTGYRPLDVFDPDKHAGFIDPKANSALVTGITFVPQSKALLIAYHKNPKVAAFEAGAQRPFKSLDHPKPVRGWAVKPDGSLVVTLAQGEGEADKGVLEFWGRAPEFRHGGEWDGLTTQTYCVAVHPKDPILATGDREGSIHLWRFTQKRDADAKDKAGAALDEVKTLRHVGPVLKVAFSGDGAALAALAVPKRDGVPLPALPPEPDRSPPRGQIMLWPCAGLWRTAP